MQNSAFARVERKGKERTSRGLLYLLCRQESECSYRFSHSKQSSGPQQKNHIGSHSFGESREGEPHRAFAGGAQCFGTKNSLILYVRFCSRKNQIRVNVLTSTRFGGGALSDKAVTATSLLAIKSDRSSQGEFFSSCRGTTEQRSSSDRKSILRLAILALFCAAHFCSSRAPAQAPPRGEPAIGGISLSQSSPRIPNPLITSGGIIAFPDQSVFLSAWTEYYPSTCKQGSTGSWTIDTRPKDGTTSTKIVRGQLANGVCPGVLFNFLALYYDWTVLSTKDKSDALTATWSANASDCPSCIATETFDLILEPYKLTVTSNGNTLNVGDCAPVSAANPPKMPELTARLTSVDGRTLTGTVAWQLAVNYVGPDSPSTNFSFSTSANVEVAIPWSISFGSTLIGANPGGGGGAKLSYTFNGVSDSFKFCINGLNPGPATAKKVIGPSPWYLFQIAEEESTTELCQFALAGAKSCAGISSTDETEPIFGAPHGFGIMQIDKGAGGDSAYELFSWPVNISAGKVKAANSASSALTFWNRQVYQYDQWNAANPKAKVPPPTDMKFGTTCKTFAYPPSSSQVPFSDGLAIQGYNGAIIYFISWNDVTNPKKPVWAEHPAPYVSSVCTKPSY